MHIFIKLRQLGNLEIISKIVYEIFIYYYNTFFKPFLSDFPYTYAGLSPLKSPFNLRL